ncbi:unnamed protein product [Ixodes hexagonus]
MSLAKPCTKRKIEDEKRLFQERWELAYFFTESRDKVLCLICQQTISVPKEYNIRRHFKSCHGEKYDALAGKIREDTVFQLKTSLGKQQDLFQKASKTSDETVRASFIVAELIAKSSKPFSDGLFIKKCLLEASNAVCPTMKKTFEKISLPPNTVAERINEISDDMEKSLMTLCHGFDAFSIAVDESTDVTDTAQCAIFVRGVDKYLNVTEELLDLVPMKGTTTGADTISVIEKVVERAGLPWEKLVCLATDGAPSMVGSKSGLVGRLRKKLADLGIAKQFAAVHCILHQEALCSKSLQMKSVMDIVFGTVNFVRSRALNHRQFVSLLEAAGSEHGELLYHTEVRWLSRGNVLKRFFDLREEIDAFLKSKNKGIAELSDAKWLLSLAFLTDITAHLNCLNAKLQGKNKIITTMHTDIRAFQGKLQLWERQLGQQKLDHFPTLKSLGHMDQESCDIFSELLRNLQKEFEERFQDVSSLSKDFEVFSLPFSVQADDVDAELQMELLELQANATLRQKFQDVGVPQFYRFLDEACFPALRQQAARIIAMFGSTYLCEHLFSLLKLNKSTLRSRITDEHLRSTMRIVSAQELKADISSLVAAKRCQVSSQRL